MEIIRYAALKPRPWRNGGGVTRELARFPESAAEGTQDGSWDWRVSIAEMSKAGDFSAFPGMDRVMTVVEGELLLLRASTAPSTLWSSTGRSGSPATPPPPVPCRRATSAT